jgi:hypothetical protein
MGSDPVFGSLGHYRSLERVTGSDPEDDVALGNRLHLYDQKSQKVTRCRPNKGQMLGGDI